MNRSFRSAAAFVFGGLAWWLSTLTLPGAESPAFLRESDWAQSLGAARAAFAGKPTELAAAAFAAYPRQTDWLLQDCGGDLKAWLETPTNADPSAAPWLRRSVAGVSGETGSGSFSLPSTCPCRSKKRNASRPSANTPNRPVSLTFFPSAFARSGSDTTPTSVQSVTSCGPIPMLAAYQSYLQV